MPGKLLIFFTASTVLVATIGGVQAQSVKGSIPLPGVPEAVAINEATNRIYVSVPSFDSPTDSLVVIDGQSDTIIDTITIPAVAYATAVDAPHDRIYVGGCYEDKSGNNICEVIAIDGKSGKLIATLPITTTPGAGIQSLAVNPVNGKLYVANASDSEVDVIRFDSKQIETRIPLSGQSPAMIAIHPETNRVFVAVSSSMIGVIDGRNDTLLATPSVGEVNEGIAVNARTGNVFVVNNVDGVTTTAVLNPGNEPVATIKVGNTPFGVAVDPVTNLAFVTNTQDDDVSVIDGTTNTVRMRLPASGTYLAVNTVTHKVYVAGKGKEVIVLREKPAPQDR